MGGCGVHDERSGPETARLCRQSRGRWQVQVASVAVLVPHFINTATFATRDFWPRRGASDAHTLQGSVRSEQRRRGPNEPSPGGLPRFSVLASLLLGHSPPSGDPPSSRLARTENRRNKRGRIYETGYLAGQKIIVIRAAVGYRSLHKPTQKNHD